MVVLAMESRIQRLIDWSIDNGSQISSKLKFESTKNRGIHAISTETSSTSSDSPQIVIPLKLIIRKELSDSFFGVELSNLNNPNSALKLLVAKLKFDKSHKTAVDDLDLTEFFAPYIDLIPVGKMIGSPIYWDDNELGLLENTNLGGSLPVKLASFLKEWFIIIKELPTELRTDQYTRDISFYFKYNRLKRKDILSELLNVTSWTSFGAYVWSTLVFTSRAFPHKIINNDVKDGQAILLPLVDLLNHNNNTKIDWNYFRKNKTGYFALHNKDILKEGDEVFNNYGAKGNEELLMGYGFVLNDNANDSIALRVKLDLDSIKKVEETGVRLPKIDDYTHYAFSNEKNNKEDILLEESSDGLLYFLNRNNLVPDNLISLFVVLVRNEKEASSTLRAKFEALQRLRAALEHKQNLIKQKLNIDKSAIDPYVISTAESYRKGQKDIYKASLSEIKSIEKTMLHDFKSHVTTLRKLYKKNESLQELTRTAFSLENYNDIEREDFVDVVLYVWLIMAAHSEDYTAPTWITKEFKTHEEGNVTENLAFKDLENLLHSQIKDGKILKLLTTRNLSIASNVIRLNSYVRISSNEIILVEPL